MNDSHAELVKILGKLSGICPTDECALSDEVAKLFGSQSVPFEREARLSDTDRVDYLVGRIGVELKVKGPVMAVTRQLSRYAQSNDVDSIILVSTRFAHRAIQRSLCGKPVSVLLVGGWL